ncbi:vitrin isoform X2 [Bombina bombina]|uniref:vitrin isoform X2 n=1 Tax=Bombina bombina TaxID=8345 RepID=UPI00235A71C2|nr:vitrin isoform X2 [Bombina bombina]
MMKERIIVVILVLFLTCSSHASKDSSKKNKKNRQHAPHIDCDIKAGKILNPEFLAKCPAGCDDTKYRVYGTDIYASFSSVCSAAIHSGVIDGSGGKILVRKVAGQSGYKGTFSNGIRSLSLPRWKESFVVAEGKGKKGVTYPSVLDYAEVKTDIVVHRVPPPTTVSTTTHSTTTSTTTTTTPEPTTPVPTTTQKPTTTTITTTATARTRPPLLRARDTGSSYIHPAYRSIVAASSRQMQAAQGRGQNQAFRSPASSTYASNRNAPRVNAGVPRQDSSVSLRKPVGNLPSSSGYAYNRVQQILAEKAAAAAAAAAAVAAAKANPAPPRNDWQSQNQRTNVQTILQKPAVPESSNVAPNAGPNWSSETYDTQAYPRREWQNPNQRVNVQTVQRKPAVPESSNLAPVAGPNWPTETRDTQVSSSSSSMSEPDRWFDGFSEGNYRNSGSETKWKVVQESSEPKTKAGETDVWKQGFYETGLSSKEEVKPRPAQIIPQGGIKFSSKEEVIAGPPEVIHYGGINCKIDLVFLMDGSWSIGKRRFRIQKLFLNQIAEALDVGLNGPLMGIVQYGDEPSTEFSLRSYSSSKDLKVAIEKIPQKGGHSHVGKALSYINKSYFSDASGNRGGAPNVAVVLVDGWPTDKVEEASRLARESGINIFFVTIEAADDNEKMNVVEPNFVDKAVCRTNGHYSINVPSWFGLLKIVQPMVKRICDTDKLVCSKTCLNAADIAFVIDGSSSVGTGNFRTVLQFIANITNEFEISDTDTRIGAVQYTYEQRLEFGFDKYSTKQDVVNAIMRIGYWSGGTSTGAAITYAFEQLFTKSKPNKRKILIVITDGRSYDDVRVPASKAHQNGVIAYAVGIAWAAHDELESIATDPDKDHSFFVDEFDSLHKFVGKIIQNICTEYNSQPRN